MSRVEVEQSKKKNEGKKKDLSARCHNVRTQIKKRSAFIPGVGWVGFLPVAFEKDGSTHFKLHQPPTTPCLYLASPAWCTSR
jgi:hypothetical protein